MFSLFKKKEPNVQTPTEIEIVSSPVDKNLFVADEDKPTTDNRPQIIVSNRSNLIDEIFSYLNMDFESKGYADAIVQPDTHYLNENIELLKNDYQLKIDHARHKFQEFLTELDFHISTRDAMGLTEIVEGLKAKKNIVKEHMVFIEKEAEDLLNDKGKIQRVKLSYTKGFKRGASALSNSFITSSNI